MVISMGLPSAAARVPVNEPAPFAPVNAALPSITLSSALSFVLPSACPVAFRP